MSLISDILKNRNSSLPTPFKTMSEFCSSSWATSSGTITANNEVDIEPNPRELDSTAQSILDVASSEAGVMFLKKFYQQYMLSDQDYRLGTVAGLKPDPTGFPNKANDPYRTYNTDTYGRYITDQGWAFEIAGDYFVQNLFPPFNKNIEEITSNCDVSGWKLITESCKQDISSRLNVRGTFTYRNPGFKQLNDQVMLFQWLFEKASGVVSTYVPEWDLSLYIQEGLISNNSGLVPNVITLLNRVTIDYPGNPLKEAGDYSTVVANFAQANAAVSVYRGDCYEIWNPALNEYSKYWTPYLVPATAGQRRDVFESSITTDEGTFTFNHWYDYIYKDNISKNTSKTSPGNTVWKEKSFWKRLYYRDHECQALSGMTTGSLKNYHAFYASGRDDLTTDETTINAYAVGIWSKTDLVDELLLNHIGVNHSTKTGDGSDEYEGSSEAIQELLSEDYSTTSVGSDDDDDVSESSGGWIKGKVNAIISNLKQPLNFLRSKKTKAAAGQSTVNNANYGGAVSAIVSGSSESAISSTSAAISSLAQTGASVTETDASTSSSSSVGQISLSEDVTEAATTIGIPQAAPGLYGGPHGNGLSPLCITSYAQTFNPNLRNLPRLDMSYYRLQIYSDLTSSKVNVAGNTIRDTTIEDAFITDKGMEEMTDPYDNTGSTNGAEMFQTRSGYEDVARSYTDCFKESYTAEGVNVSYSTLTGYEVYIQKYSPTFDMSSVETSYTSIKNKGYTWTYLDDEDDKEYVRYGQQTAYPSFIYSTRGTKAASVLGYITDSSRPRKIGDVDAYFIYSGEYNSSFGGTTYYPTSGSYRFINVLFNAAETARSSLYSQISSCIDNFNTGKYGNRYLSSSNVFVSDSTSSFWLRPNLEKIKYTKSSIALFDSISSFFAHKTGSVIVYGRGVRAKNDSSFSAGSYSLVPVTVDYPYVEKQSYPDYQWTIQYNPFLGCHQFFVRSGSLSVYSVGNTAVSYTDEEEVSTYLTWYSDMNDIKDLIDSTLSGYLEVVLPTANISKALKSYEGEKVDRFIKVRLYNRTTTVAKVGTYTVELSDTYWCTCVSRCTDYWTEERTSTDFIECPIIVAEVVGEIPLDTDVVDTLLPESTPVETALKRLTISKGNHGPGEAFEFNLGVGILPEDLREPMGSDNSSTCFFKPDGMRFYQSSYEETDYTATYPKLESETSAYSGYAGKGIFTYLEPSTSANTWNYFTELRSKEVSGYNINGYLCSGTIPVYTAKSCKGMAFSENYTKRLCTCTFFPETKVIADENDEESLDENKYRLVSMANAIRLAYFQAKSQYEALNAMISQFTCSTFNASTVWSLVENYVPAKVRYLAGDPSLSLTQKDFNEGHTETVKTASGDYVNKNTLYGYNDWMKKAVQFFYWKDVTGSYDGSEERIKNGNIISDTVYKANLKAYFNVALKRISDIKDSCSFCLTRPYYEYTIDKYLTARNTLFDRLKAMVEDEAVSRCFDFIYAYMNVLYEARKTLVNFRMNKQDGTYWFCRQFEKAIPQVLSATTASSPSLELSAVTKSSLDVAFYDVSRTLRDQLKALGDKTYSPPERIVYVYIPVKYTTETAWKQDLVLRKGGEAPSVAKVAYWTWKRNEDGSYFRNQAGSKVRLFTGDWKYVELPADGEYTLSSSELTEELENESYNASIGTSSKTLRAVNENIFQVHWTINWGVPTSRSGYQSIRSVSDVHGPATSLGDAYKYFGIFAISQMKKQVSKETGNTDICFDITTSLNIQRAQELITNGITEPMDLICGSRDGGDYWQVKVESAPLPCAEGYLNNVKLVPYVEDGTTDSTCTDSTFGLMTNQVWPIVAGDDWEALSEVSQLDALAESMVPTYE